MVKKKSYLTLFKETFYISAFTIGGGYVILPLLEKKFVDELKWIDQEEMVDLIAIAQTLPGVMAINAVMMIGKKLFGYKGALVATLGTLIPPIVSLLIISYFYEMIKHNQDIQVILRGMQAAIAAIIIKVAIVIFKNTIKSKAILNTTLFVIALILSLFLNISVIYLILGAFIISIIIYLVESKV